MSDAAVFLDRDGVINHHWFNPATAAWESPIRPADFRAIAGAFEALAALRAGGFRLFLVSNQPSAAKGKCSRADLDSVHRHMAAMLARAEIRFDGFYYAYGHPEAADFRLRDVTDRKPEPLLIDRAVARFALDRRRCWMVGDRDTDIACGRRAGVRTIQVRSPEPDGKAGFSRPDFHAPDLAAAARLIFPVNDAAMADAMPAG